MPLAFADLDLDVADIREIITADYRVHVFTSFHELRLSLLVNVVDNCISSLYPALVREVARVLP